MKVQMEKQFCIILVAIANILGGRYRTPTYCSGMVKIASIYTTNCHQIGVTPLMVLGSPDRISVFML